MSYFAPWPVVYPAGNACPSCGRGYGYIPTTGTLSSGIYYMPKHRKPGPAQ